MAWSSSSRIAGCCLLVAASLALAMSPCRSQGSPEDFLAAHNATRGEVGVGPVTWDDTVATYAQSYAAAQQGSCTLQHSGTEKYGENLFWGAGADWTAADAVASWVSEKQWYDDATNTCSPPDGASCGQYTQVVWRNSTFIGCARVVCDNDGGVFIICNYSPPGNIVGEYPY